MLRRFWASSTRFEGYVTFVVVSWNLCRIHGTSQLQMSERSAVGVSNLKWEKLRYLEIPKDASLLLHVLLHGNSQNPNTLIMDACDVETGCVIIQKQADKVVSESKYWSRLLIDTEGPYGTKQTECLAMVWDFLLLRSYLRNNRITKRSDHGSLKKWIWRKSAEYSYVGGLDFRNTGLTSFNVQKANFKLQICLHVSTL